MIEACGLQSDFLRLDFGKRSLGKNIRGDVLDRRVGNFMNEADVPVLAGRNSGDDFAPGDFGIDDGFAATPSVIDHDNEILHPAPTVTGQLVNNPNIAENRNMVKT